MDATRISLPSKDMNRDSSSSPMIRVPVMLFTCPSIEQIPRVEQGSICLAFISQPTKLSQNEANNILRKANLSGQEKLFCAELKAIDHALGFVRKVTMYSSKFVW